MPHKPIRVHHNKIRTWDWLLILGLTIAPMTGLRIWKIGPAEVLTFIWCLRFFPRGRVSNGALMRFFLVFLGSMAIGTIMGLFWRRKKQNLLIGLPGFI